MSNIGTDDGIEAQLPVAATDATAQQLEPDIFTWNSCGDYDDQKRIKIKEEALEFGLLQCEKLIQKLESSSLSNSGTSDPLVSTSLGWTDVEKWIKKCSRYFIALWRCYTNGYYRKSYCYSQGIQSPRWRRRANRQREDVGS